MFDRAEIYLRFASCLFANRPVTLARTLGLHYATVYQWKSGKKPIPWYKLKRLVDDQNLSWDWLIEGKGPKLRRRDENDPCRPLNRHAINERFLSLYPDMSQAQLGKELGVNQTTIFKWRHDMSQVPWERLKRAVDTLGVTWEWLLEGRR